MRSCQFTIMPYYMVNNANVLKANSPPPSPLPFFNLIITLFSDSYLMCVWVCVIKARNKRKKGKISFFDVLRKKKTGFGKDLPIRGHFNWVCFLA